MYVIDPGHAYALHRLDAGRDESQVLYFVKRQGDKYPGNSSSYPGTTIQEVMRACIDRIKYVNNQVPCMENEAVLGHLRAVILLLEARAAERHGYHSITPQGEEVEQVPTDPMNGHWSFGEKKT